MTDLLDKISNYLGLSTNWGRWIGTLIISDILFIWTKVCLVKGELVAPDMATSSILVAVYMVNALKPSSSPKE